MPKQKIEIIKTPVQTVLVSAKCPSCKDGFLYKTGQSFTTSRTHYEHKCPACGHFESLEREHPYIDYQKIVKKRQGSDHELPPNGN